MRDSRLRSTTAPPIIASEDGTRTASAGGEHTYIDTCTDDSREIYLFLNRLSNFYPEGTYELHFQMRI